MQKWAKPVANTSFKVGCPSASSTRKRAAAVKRVREQMKRRRGFT